MTPSGEEVPNGDCRLRWFSDIRIGDVALVGGKNASLGELYSTLSKQGVRGPSIDKSVLPSIIVAEALPKIRLVMTGSRLKRALRFKLL
jgi:phosphoenolpyruvate synthase/pyruvate phosphate dikinase